MLTPEEAYSLRKNDAAEWSHIVGELIAAGWADGNAYVEAEEQLRARR